MLLVGVKHLFGVGLIMKSKRKHFWTWNSKKEQNGKTHNVELSGNKLI